MTAIVTVLASGFETGAVLTLALPLLVLLAVAIWYYTLFRRGMGER